ncbi:winged helix-turn-helix domain-containing protein [Aquimarina litoralis]|uniref:winged helix-turn-helix domain-containing protein n=1 Tax=Aquimarina litoralis TaxID=584605 RepID=UPI001C5A481A|nr:winged helix-turn-helix domain-containing protein [Aquimarina litoralis]MBW1296501.1 winged helix family transcriptional regulator [Aquimarina litoralis]
MRNNIKIITVILILIIGCLSIYSFSAKQISFYPEKVKVALRSVGNQLLLKNNDTTSLVLPVREISDQVFELSFQKEIAINPEDLVQFMDTELTTIGLPNNYITELVNCKTNEVSYSYEMLGPLEESKISCIGRNLPENCYTIKVIMLETEAAPLYGSFGNIYTFSFLLLFLIFIYSLTFFKQKSKEQRTQVITDHMVLGSFLFFPNQQKLMKDGKEIGLTAKECELLSIFANHPNEIIKREELIKKVWEDNGVIVGRSLDMFISKLRKKLDNNSDVKIVNIHGVGYKLETNTTK